MLEKKYKGTEKKKNKWALAAWYFTVFTPVIHYEWTVFYPSSLHLSFQETVCNGTIWASPSENLSKGICEQRRPLPPWNYTQQSLQSSVVLIITKTYLYNFDPLKPHFYIVKLGFTGVYIIFLISAQNIDYGYSLEPPRRGGSNEYPQSMFWAEIWKI